MKDKHMTDIQSIIAKMTLEEKAALCTGASSWSTTASWFFHNPSGCFFYLFSSQAYLSLRTKNAEKKLFLSFVLLRDLCGEKSLSAC